LLDCAQSYSHKKMEITLNDYQKRILKVLLYTPRAKFSELQPEEMTSKHFNYHLHKLIEYQLLEKADSGYILTESGKEYVGRLDEKTMDLEKQPKVSIAILATRTNSSGESEYLLSKRLKQPYFGKVGGFTGKVRFGETFEAAARREFLEESGLTGDFRLAKFTRKIAYDEKGACIQDQLMFFFRVTNVKGELITKTPEQENFWYPEAALHKRKDLFNTFLQFVALVKQENIEIMELITNAEGY